MKKKNLTLLSFIILISLFLPLNVKAVGKNEDNTNKCSYGYTQVGNMCQKITNAYQGNGTYYCPPNSGTLDPVNKKCVLSYTLDDEDDTSVSCNSGYISDGEKCYKIVGTADYRNDQYYCDTPNTYLIGTSCVEGSVKDVIENNNSENKNDNNNDNNSNNNADEVRDQYIGKITCGGLTKFTFHKRVPKLTSTLYNLLKVAIPVLLVVMGMMDMFKAMSAGKEDEMQKAKKKFINRLIAAICAFIVFVLVETVITWVADRTGNANAMKCVNCFINNKCDNN